MPKLPCTCYCEFHVAFCDPCGLLGEADGLVCMKRQDAPRRARPLAAALDVQQLVVDLSQ